MYRKQVDYAIEQGYCVCSAEVGKEKGSLTKHTVDTEDGEHTVRQAIHYVQFAKEGQLSP